MHRQITVVAILMIVQGSLEIVLGLIFAVGGPALLSFGSLSPGRSGATPPPGEMMTMMYGLYIGMGVVAFIIGVLKIVAGIRNLKYRGRTLGIVALASGAVALVTCYCFPTGLGLLIYGLIVYVNSSSGKAFELGEQGMSPSEIKQTLDAPPGYYPPPNPV
jgi:hypothetical protein